MTSALYINNPIKSSLSSSPSSSSTSSSPQLNRANSITNQDEDVFYNATSFMNNSSIMMAHMPDDATFLKSLVQIENIYNEKLQNGLEQNGISKRFIGFSTFNQLGLHFNSALNNLNADHKSELRQLIVDLIDTECTTLIAWAKNIPDFQSLSIEDQTYSIELNFLEVILIDYIWRSVSHAESQASNLSSNSANNRIGDGSTSSPLLSPSSSASPSSSYPSSSPPSSSSIFSNHNDLMRFKFVLHQNLKLTRSICKDLEIEDIYDHLISIVIKLGRMQISFQEYLCLKALALFKSDYGFTNVEQMEKFREKMFPYPKASKFESM